MIAHSPAAIVNSPYQQGRVKESKVKATGIVRKVDELGRIVIPIELRRNLNISIHDPIEIFVDDDYIMLKKYEPACIFCGNAKDIRLIHGKNVCADCISQLKNEAL